MKFKILVYGICIFVIMIVQTTFLNSLTVFGIKPNLMLVFIVSVALIRGGNEGACIGFFAGLTQDLVTGKIIGFYAILGLYIGLLVGIFNKRLYRENFIVIVFFTIAATVVYELCVFLFGIFILSSENGVLYGFRDVILPETLYNVIISVFIYIFVTKISDMFNEQDKKIRKY